MFRTILIAAAFLLAITLPLAALADAYGELQKMHSTFDSAASWHADEHMPDGRVVSVDHVAPDRWRIINPSITEIVVGNNVYMMRGSHVTALPPFMGGIVQKTLSAFLISSYGADIKQSARDLGMRTIAGKPAHAYAYQVQGAHVTMYVGADHLPVASVVQGSNGTTTIDYSQWNGAISINLP
jgi:hypothetical protein